MDSDEDELYIKFTDIYAFWSSTATRLEEYSFAIGKADEDFTEWPADSAKGRVMRIQAAMLSDLEKQMYASPMMKKRDLGSVSEIKGNHNLKVIK